MEVKIFGKKVNRQVMSGVLALLIAAGSVTPAADAIGLGGQRAYAELVENGNSQAINVAVSGTLAGTTTSGITGGSDTFTITLD